MVAIANSQFPFDAKQKHDAARKRLETVWIGECVCGLMVYELENGWRFDLQNQRHTAGACQARRKAAEESPEGRR